MAMEKQLSYDEALKRVDTIVSQLEQSEAISVDAYKQLADEATRLLDYCRKEIEKLATDVKS